MRLVAFFAAMLVALSLAATARAQTVTANWSDMGVANLAAVPRPSSVTASDGTSVTLATAVTNNAQNGAFNSVYGGYLSYYTGQIGAGTGVLLAAFDNDAMDPGDRITMTITLDRTVRGLRFSLDDIDEATGFLSTSTFRDAVMVEYDDGSGFVNAANNTAFWTAGSTVVRTNDATVNGWTGSGSSDTTATNGTLQFAFGNQAVKRIRITYYSDTRRNTLYDGANPVAQLLGVSSLRFDARGADLSLAKTLIGSAPANGGTATYRLTVTSAATSELTANAIAVKDRIPAGFTVTGSSDATAFNASTGVWTVGSLAPGASKTLDITGTVSATAGVTITNTAEITASSAPDPDSTPNNVITTEDDYASVALVVAGTRAAGVAPALVCPAGNTIFDWDARAWTAGATSAAYPLDAIGQVSFNLQNPGLWLNNATYGGQSPVRQNVVNGGTGQFGLFKLVDLADRTSAVTTTITLPAIMRGAQFTIFDVDYTTNQFADRTRVTGRYQGATVMPTLTNGAANYVIGNQAFGDATSADAENKGNVVVTFTQPVDTIIIEYGNHALAPANPSQQAITVHDITMCRPTTSIVATKTSTVLSDPINGTTNPKAVPGARVQYCVLLRNSGDTAAANVAASDALPAKSAYVAGSLKSGVTCSTASTPEDDDITGADENDPFGASITASTVKVTAASLGAGATMAATFETHIE